MICIRSYTSVILYTSANDVMSAVRSVTRYTGVNGGVTKHRTGRTGLKYRSILYKKGKFSVSELHWKFQELTEIGRITVVMYVSDHFFHGKVQFTDFRDPSTKLGFWVGTRLE